MPANQGTATTEDSQVYQPMPRWRRDSGWTTDSHIAICLDLLYVLISSFSKSAIGSHSNLFGSLIRSFLARWAERGRGWSPGHACPGQADPPTGRHTARWLAICLLNQMQSDSVAVERFLFQASREQLNSLTHTPSITAELHKGLFTRPVNPQLWILPLRPQTSKLLQKYFIF